ncbi:MAG: hypothetical protein KHZ58_17605 [Hungatella hathewayi]|nr:hypothetical protein [Hungatella hathewayi]
MRQRRYGYMKMTAAVILSLSIQEPMLSHGATGTAEETKVEISMMEGSHSVETELQGTIEVSLISAALPSDVEFGVDPEGRFDATANPGGQIQGPSPTEFRIRNNSVVPVRLEIAEVEELRQGDVVFSEAFAGGPVQSFRLVDRISEVEEYGTAILVLGTAGRTYGSDADFEQYAICPGKKGILITDLGAEEEAGLQIYGKVSADFYGAYQFTIRPVLKISAVRAG